MPRDLLGNFMRTDPITGRRISKKQIKKEVIAENRRKGRAAEEQVATSYMLKGYEVERTGRGSDLRVRKRDIFGSGRVTGSKLVEVKSGKAKLSKLQQRTKRKKSNYKVERVDPYFY